MTIAFCFMSYGDIEHMEIWQRFFADADADASIFLHTVRPITESKLPRTTIIPTQPTEWGTFSLVEVQQRLFEAAFADPTVNKFVLLSGDTIPLYKFATVRDRLERDDKGHMVYKTIPNGDKYKVDISAWPSDKPWVWSRTYQWVILNREHVALLQAHFPMIRAVFGPSYIPDEHVYPIFFNAFDMLETFNPTSHIYIDWRVRQCSGPIIPMRRLRINSCRERHRDKPWTFHTEDFTRQTVQKIYASDCMFLRKVCRSAHWEPDRLLTS